MRALAFNLALLVASTVVSAQPSATAPLVPDPLRWGMDVDAAVKVLTAAKLSPRQGATRGYVARNPGDTGPISHTVEPGVWFVPASGWTGEAHFAWVEKAKGYRLDRVTLTGDVSAREAKQALAALERRYGAPAAHAGPQRLWVRGGVWLVANASEDAKTKRWSLYVSYALDERPLPPKP